MEDPYLWAILARSIERIIVVIFAGLTIYFGFRLFVLLPVQKDNSGRIELPGVSVVMSKVGPGVFFAAFGAVILLMAFQNKVAVNVDPKITDLNQPRSSYVGFSSSNTIASDGKEQELARARLAIQVLNCVEKFQVGNTSIIKKSDLEISVSDAKLALLRNVWDKEKWGEYRVFVDKLKSGILEGDEPVWFIFSELMPKCDKRESNE